MSERWVLVPRDLVPTHPLPPVSREWLDAAVERGLDAYAGKTPWHHGYTALAVINIRADFRAAILAALEMTDG